jgi:membrane-bound metal-dependent hydrolase YbcI (DUF457 family)
VTRRAAALGCLAVIAGADHVIARHRPPWILSGLFDHPAHLATNALVLLNAGRRTPGWRSAFMAGALAPDMDHIPLALRPVRPTLASPRPVTHCLAAVAPVALGAAAWREPRLGALAAGMLVHFARDVGVGTGVPLLWPLTRRSFRVPHGVYLAGCALLATRATLDPGL